MHRFNEMAKASFICGLLWVLTAQSAVINNGGTPVKRIARSPYSGESEDRGPRLPPSSPPANFGPPPPIFHTHQWTGVERTTNGINGVFSGAAADSEDSGQTKGQAFSLASSRTDAGATAGAVARAGANIGFGADSSGVGIHSSLGSSSGGYGGHPAAGYSGYSATGRGDFNRNGNYNGKTAGSNGGRDFTSFRESHYSYSGNKHGQSDQRQGVNNNGFQQDVGQIQSSEIEGHSNRRAQSSSYGNRDIGQTQSSGIECQSNRRAQSSSYGSRDIGQTQSSGFETQPSDRGQSSLYDGGNVEQSEHSRLREQSYARAQSSSYGGVNGWLSNNYGSGVSGRHHGQHENLIAGGGSSNEERRQSGSEYLGGNEQHLQSTGGRQLETGFSSSQGLTHQSSGNSQSALSGALDLASQGLQAAQQTETSGCSTCGKGNYALSNAKSHSGDAVAVSVGG